MRKWLAGMIAFALLVSCNKESAPDCFQTAGDDAVEIRELGPFQELELHDYLQFELVDTNYYGVEIHGPRNLLPEIETSIKEGKLLIENKNSCNWVRSFKKRITVRIFAPEFPLINNYATGDIRSLNVIDDNYMQWNNRHAAGVIQLKVAMDSVSVRCHTGVADVDISGTCAKAELFNQGVGILDARGLQSHDASVNNSTINDVYVNVSGYFFAYIEFSGNIYYSGSPNYIDKQRLGNGDVIRLP